MTGKRAKTRLGFFIQKAREFKGSTRYWMKKANADFMYGISLKADNKNLMKKSDEYYESIQEANRLFRRVNETLSASSQVSKDLEIDIELYMKRHKDI